MNLLKAYKNTNYQCSNGMLIKVGCINPELDKLLEEHGLKFASFITAWNPFSWTTLDKRNNASNKKLRKELLKLVSSDQIIDGTGIDSTGEWQGEESFLALGLNEQDATNLAILFGQNAYVLYEMGAGASLILTVHFKN